MRCSSRSRRLPAPLLVSAGLGFGPETTVLVACALFVAGISTIVQTLGIGKRAVAAHRHGVQHRVRVSGPAIAPQVGYAGYVGACLVGSVICGVVFFTFSDKLKVVVPSFVSGAVVFVLGTTLLGVALGVLRRRLGQRPFRRPGEVPAGRRHLAHGPGVQRVRPGLPARGGAAHRAGGGLLAGRRAGPRHFRPRGAGRVVRVSRAAALGSPGVRLDHHRVSGHLRRGRASGRHVGHHDAHRRAHAHQEGDARRHLHAGDH